MSFLQKLLELKDTYDHELELQGISPTIFKTERDKFVYLALKAVEYNMVPKYEIPLIMEPSFSKAANSCESVYEMANFVIGKLRSDKKVKFGQNSIRVFESTPLMNVKKPIPIHQVDPFLKNENGIIKFEELQDEIHSPLNEPSIYTQKLNNSHTNVSIHNLNNDVVKGYDSIIPFKTPNKDEIDYFLSGEFLDLELYMRTGKILYYDLDEYYDEDESDMKIFFYLLPDGTLIERDNLETEYDYGDAYLFVYPAPEFYKNQGNHDRFIIDEMVEKYYDQIHNKIDEYVRQYTNGAI